jgi:hypothetical protein
MIMDVNELINSIDCYIEMDVQNEEYLFGEYTCMWTYYLQKVVIIRFIKQLMTCMWIWWK